MSVQIVQLGEKDLTKFAMAIQQLAQGRSNATGTVTLTASAASSTVKAVTCGVGSIVLFMPQTANAAAELGAGTMYVTSTNVTKGQFVITHANNSQADRTFGWVVLG